MTSPFRGTGSPDADSRDDFSRARRAAQWARVLGRMRGRVDEIGVMLPFDEVVAALGRRGEELPPIDVYRVGEAHFVRDGHHRVAVARALGWQVISAFVTEVLTEVGASRDLTMADLPLKSHERLFWERVPLPAPARSAVVLTDPERYATLAEGVEAWGFRWIQRRRRLASRQQVAEAWLREEFVPTVRLLREADLIGLQTDAEAYQELSGERYRLLLTHEWSQETLDTVAAEHRSR